MVCSADGVDEGRQCRTMDKGVGKVMGNLQGTASTQGRAAGEAAHPRAWTGEGGRYGNPEEGCCKDRVTWRELRPL